MRPLPRTVTARPLGKAHKKQWLKSLLNNIPIYCAYNNNNMKLATSLILVALAIAGNIASGETFRGLKKDKKKKKGKKDSVWCEGLDGPLKGLCNAYCDAMECHEDPNSNGCDRVLENYNKKKGGDDPAMPCLTPPTQCPCWTLEDLQNYPEPPSDSTCERDWNRCGDDGGQYNQDKIFYQSGLCDTGEFIAEIVGCAAF